MVNNYQKQWGFLKKNFESGSLAHAFLFSGQDSESIAFFTKEFVRLMNCKDEQYSTFQTFEKLSTRKDSQTNGKTCQSCKMINAGTFPDLLTVKSSESKSSKENEKDMMEIDVQQIRDVETFLSYKSYYGGIRAVVLENAERMNFQAQNCFLKTLEEPRGKTIIFLLTSKPDLLLPTVFSRCQHIKFFDNGSCEISNGEQKILQELESVINSSLAEKFNYAKNANLEGVNLVRILNVLQKYFRQLLILKIGADSSTEENRVILKFKKILLLIEDLIYKTSTTNVNKKLALEILLLEL